MVSVAEITGMEFASIEEAAAYYEVKSARITGAPAFSESVLPWLRYLDNAASGEAWESLVKRITAEHSIAERAGNLFAALYPDDESERFKRLYVLKETEQDAFDAVLAEASTEWSVENNDPLALEVVTRLIELTPLWSFLPVTHEQNTADYIWSRMRCLIAGMGYNNHAHFTKILTGLYPNCPFVEDETKEVWHKALVEAHKNCGWPIQLILVEWKAMQRCFDTIDVYVPEEWLNMAAVLHVLKHVRVSDTNKTIVSTFGGRAVHYEILRKMTMIGQSKLVASELAKNLGVAAKDKGWANPLSHAFAWAMNALGINQLLRRRSLTTLPGTVMCGAWSTLMPDATGMHGFVQHGLRLTGVWLAHNGKVLPYTGESVDVVSFDWNIEDAAHAKHDELRRALEAIMPETYTSGFASDLFFESFPNLVVPPNADLNAIKSLFDAPLVASLIRADVPVLGREFPAVVFMPASPTMDESTNQGKTLAALVYTRIMQPGVVRATTGLDSGSAPDIRMAASMLRQHGTMCLDEFKVPTAQNHPLSSRNMFSLCTGGAVPIGKALENSGESDVVTLNHSLTLSAKALSVGSDMNNRLFSFYLNTLTNEQRSNGKLIDSLESGALSMLARLQMLALVMEHNVAGELDAAINGSSNEMRFRGHRTLARILYKIRTGRDENGEIDATIEEMHARFAEHIHEADDNGVLSMLEDGRSLRIRLSSVFTDLSVEEVATMADHMNTKPTAERQGYRVTTVTELLQARLNIAGLHGRPFCDLLLFLSGSRIRTGNRQVSIALAREIRNTVHHGIGWRLPGHLGLAGWYLFRFDNGSSQLVALVNVNKAEAVPPKA